MNYLESFNFWGGVVYAGLPAGFLSAFAWIYFKNSRIKALCAFAVCALVGGKFGHSVDLLTIFLSWLAFNGSLHQRRMLNKDAPTQGQANSRVVDQVSVFDSLFGSSESFKKQALEDGSRNLPGARADQPSLAEAGIRETCSKLITQKKESILAAFSELRKKRERIFNEVEFNTIKQELAAIDTQLGDSQQQIFDEVEQNYQKALDDVKTMEPHFNKFRMERGITRPAIYPESKLLHLSLVAVFLLLEAFLNATFFDTGSGMFAAYMIAFSVAALNVAVALGLGILFRFKNDNQSPNRFWGYLALPGFIFSALAINAGVACYRAFLDIKPDLANTGEAFFSAVTKVPGFLMFHDVGANLHSFLLFGVGLLGAAIAFWKGYRLDDSIPGYGEQDRTLNTYRARLSEMENTVRQRLIHLVDEARAKVDSTIAAFKAKQTTYLQTIVDQEVLAEEFSSTIDECLSRSNSYLKVYRATNSAVRTEPEPSFFKVFLGRNDFTQEVSIDVPLVDRVRIENIAEKINGINKLCEEEIKSLSEKRTLFKSSFDAWRKQMLARLEQTKTGPSLS